MAWAWFFLRKNAVGSNVGFVFVMLIVYLKPLCKEAKR